MRYFDLHCDTMTECALKNIPLRRNLLHVDLDTVQGWERYVQCYAVWLPDELRGEPAWQRFLQVAERFSQEVEKNAGCLRQLRAPGDLDSLEESGRHGAILTVESSAVLGGRLERIQDLGAWACACAPSPGTGKQSWDGGCWPLATQALPAWAARLSR